MQGYFIVESRRVLDGKPIASDCCLDRVAATAEMINQAIKPELRKHGSYRVTVLHWQPEVVASRLVEV